MHPEMAVIGSGHSKRTAEQPTADIAVRSGCRLWKNELTD